MNLFQNYRVHILKKIINNYFRKYISIIANKCNISKVPAISFITVDELATEMQQYIIFENQRIIKYITPENSVLFKNFKFEYSFDFINNIYGISDIYNCKYTKIIKESNFNIVNTGDLLLYLLLKQLTNFLIQPWSEYEFHNSNDKEFDLLKHDNNKIFAKFIISIFDIIQDNEESLNLSDKRIDKFKTNKRENIIMSSIAAVDKLDGLAKQFYFSKATRSGSIDELDYAAWDEDNNIKEKLDLEDNTYGLETMAKKELTDITGSAPTESEISDFTESYLENEKVDMDDFESDFIFDDPKEGLDVIESGYNYGSLPQGGNDD